MIKETYTLGEAIGYLVTALDVPPENWTKFDARVHNLRRLGFCRDGIRGPGKTSILKPADILILYIAMKLNLSGINPEIVGPIAEREVVDLIEYSGDAASAKRIASLPLMSFKIPTSLTNGQWSLSISMQVPSDLKAAVLLSGEERRRAA